MIFSICIHNPFFQSLVVIHFYSLELYQNMYSLSLFQNFMYQVITFSL